MADPILTFYKEGFISTIAKSCARDHNTKHKDTTNTTAMVADFLWWEIVSISVVIVGGFLLWLGVAGPNPMSPFFLFFLSLSSLGTINEIKARIVGPQTFLGVVESCF